MSLLILGVIINHYNGTDVYKEVQKTTSILILGVTINHPNGMDMMSTRGSQKTTSISIQGVIINLPNGTNLFKGVAKDYIDYIYINSRCYYQPP